MCGVCGLPSTHVNTIQTISLVPIFFLVFTTFLWAWWMVTRLRVENYFLNTFNRLTKKSPLKVMSDVKSYDEHTDKPLT
jgi:hypothetical protein